MVSRSYFKRYFYNERIENKGFGAEQINKINKKVKQAQIELKAVILNGNGIMYQINI